MPDAELHARRMKQILLDTCENRELQELKRLVRNWRSPGGPGQDAFNRAVVRAIDHIQRRMDALLRA